MLLKAFRFVLAALAAMYAAAASSSIIYFADDQGNVGVYDDVANSAAAVGNLGGFSIGQVIGIAYDAANSRILILDRSVPAVYTMDPGTGNASLLFTPSQQFQGGAVKGNTLYGIDEGSQTVVAYDLTTFNPVAMSGAGLPGHTHAIGIIAASGQLIIQTNNTIYAMGDDGTPGAALAPTPGFDEDVDGYGANYLAVDYGTQVYQIDGSGNQTVLVSSAQTSGAGVTSSISGVVLAEGAIVGPGGYEEVPATPLWALALMALLLVALAAAARRRV